MLDAAGNPVQARNRDGQVVHRRYYAADRVQSVHVGDPAAAPVTRFTYHDRAGPAPPDAGAHTNGGRLVRVDDARAGVTVLDYDARGELAVKRFRPVGSAVEYRLDLEWRADGQLAAVTYPAAVGSRLRVEHHYDVLGRLSEIPAS